MTHQVQEDNYKCYEELSIGSSGSKIERVREQNSLIFQASHDFNLQIPQLYESAKHQIRVLKKLEHPNIISLEHYFETPSSIVLVTELCQPYSLFKLIEKDKVLPLSSVYLFAHDIIDALYYLHENNYLHNDICANNFILSNNGILKLIEYESTDEISKCEQLDIEMIEFSIRKNGYLHRAPETLMDGGSYSYQSDFYSLGCTLYELAFDAYPFKELDNGDYSDYAKQVFAQGKELLKRNIPPKESRELEFPSEFYELLYKLLEPIPFERGNWSDILECRELFSIEFEAFKPSKQPLYVKCLEKICEEGFCGQEFLEAKFDPRGNLLEQVQQEENIQQIIQKQVTQMQEQQPQEHLENDTIEESEVSTAADMTIRQVKKHTQLHYLASQTQYYYNELAPLLLAQNQNSFIYSWMKEFTQIIITRNNAIKEQELITVDVEQSVVPKDNLCYEELAKLEGEEYLEELEILLKKPSSENPFKFQEHDELIDLFNYMSQLIYCTFSIREKTVNNTKINSKLFTSSDVFERSLACMTVLLYEYREEIIEEFENSPINEFFVLLRFILEHEIYNNCLTGLSLICEFIVLTYTMLMTDVVEELYVEQILKIELIEMHELFVKNINSSLIEENYLHSSKKDSIEHLSKCIVYFNFCINLAAETINLRETEQVKQNIFERLSFTDFIIAAQNIFMFIHEDTFVSSLKQKASPLINKLIEQSTYRSSIAYAALTDLRLHNIVQYSELVPAYFDFIIVMKDISATRNILEALVEFILHERFKVLDVYEHNYKLSENQNYKAEQFIIDNYYRLLNLEEFPAQDDVLLAQVALLMSAIMFTDPYLFKIFKNPLNAGNTKLYQFTEMADSKFDEKVDEMIQRCGIKYNNEFLVETISQLLCYIELIFDACLHSVKSVAIQGVYINQEHITKCNFAFDLIVSICTNNCQSQSLFFTQYEVTSLESIIFSIVNTMIGSHPPEIETLKEYKDIKNEYERINEETYIYVNKVINITKIYLNYPWANPLTSLLFYEADKQYKGLYECILNLSKDPYNICSLGVEKVSPSFRKIMMLLHSESLLIFDVSLEKFVYEGPVLQYIDENNELEKRGDIYFVTQDNISTGLLSSLEFTSSQAGEYQELAKTILTRFLASKTIFNQSFLRIDERTECALRIAVLAIKFGITSDSLYQIAEKCLVEPPAIAKIAAEVIELLCVKNVKFCQQELTRIDEMVKQPDVFLGIISTCYNELKESAYLLIEDSKNEITKLCKAFEYVDAQELIIKCIQSLQEFFKDNLIEMESIIIKMQLVANYYILFLNFLTIDEEYISELFTTAVGSRKILSSKFVDAFLDLYEECSQSLAKAGWSGLTTQCAIFGNINDRQIFRLNEIQRGIEPIQWPKGWFV